ncbi:MAG: hypothetical protein QNJ44_14455 [Rhodobacter sp.]|nr:hypothetical protein [Rhodobacter sp.]
MALLLWPLVCLVLFRSMKLERAVIWSLIGGYLLLPPVASFDLPLVPPLDKSSIPSVSVFLICLVFLGRNMSVWPHSKLARLLLAGFVIGSVPTVLANSDAVVFEVFANSDPISFPAWSLPGLGLRDVASAFGGQVIAILPFLLARHLLATEDNIRELLLAIVIAALVYSVPALIEIRLSPQINTWVYGFFQHEFVQTMRSGGFRPIVFLEHPLWLAIFVVAALLSATALMKASVDERRVRFVLAMIYLAGLLYLCKSLASFAYGVCLVPVVLFAGMRLQIKIAVAFALAAVIYPLLRGVGWVPVEDILEWANSVNPARAASLAYRFETETLLLERASERPWVGWGGWGRNLIHDSETGELLTIPDGRWIIVFGTYGWLGYVCEFGLLSLPIFLLGRAALNASGHHISPYAAAAVLILGINMVDMLLNAALTPITWMLAGAGLGYAERLKLQQKADAAVTLRPAIGTVAKDRVPTTIM